MGSDTKNIAVWTPMEMAARRRVDHAPPFAGFLALIVGWPGFW